MKIAIIGTGYVGLVTGTCLADLGHEILCVDNDTHKISQLKNKKITIYEPGLEDLFDKNINSGRLQFTTSLIDGLHFAQALFLCLPTPPNAVGGSNIDAIIEVSDFISTHATKKTVVINKSTVPVGTADLIQKRSNNNIFLASNPEFLREGNAVIDFLKPDRIVIGANSDYAFDVVNQIYEPLWQKDVKTVQTDLRSSELIKYASNAFLATKISFINEIAHLCESVDANIDDVSYGMGLDNRIGEKFLQAGIGYGGSCFPKDILAIRQTAKQYNQNLQILDAVTKVNDAQKAKFLAKIIRRYGADMKGMLFAVRGLAFKAKTDDVRNSPAIGIIQALLHHGAQIIAYDPQAQNNFKQYSGLEIEYVDEKYKVLDHANGLLVLTNWQEFKYPDFEKIKKLVADPVIFDGRNLYNPQEAKKHHIEYYSMGRGTID